MIYFNIPDVTFTMKLSFKMAKKDIDTFKLIIVKIIHGDALIINNIVIIGENGLG